MATTGQTILGVFDKSAMADQAINALQTAGFSSTQIHEAGHHPAGGFMAGLKNFFAGDDTTTDANDFLGMGMSDEETRYYENESQAGHRVLAVQAKGREQEAMDILRANGASTYGGAPQAIRSETTSTSTLQTAKAGKNVQTASVDTNEEQMLHLRGEQLNINKQRVQSGEVDLHKEIVTEQKTVDVPVTHEEVFIERHPSTNAITTDTTPIGESETIRVPVREEQVAVSKDTVVTGEVTIGKRAVEETQQVNETVRREEARVEQKGDAPIHGTKSDRFHPESVDENAL